LFYREFGKFNDFCQQMHSSLKHKMLQLTLKISLYMAPTYSGPFGPSSGNTRWNLAKITGFVEIISKNTSLKLLLYRLKHILPLHSNNFNDVFLLIISTKTVTLARFRRMIPDDGPSGPKHVGAIKRDILSVRCNILCFNTEWICWQKALNIYEIFNCNFIKITVLIDVIRVISPLVYSVNTAVKFYSNSYIEPDGGLIISRNLYM
jgi:hypothetical protein